MAPLLYNHRPLQTNQENVHPWCELDIIKKRFLFYSKIQSHAVQSWDENLALIPIVGKSGFVSHTKHTAEATNIDLFHLWLITCTM